MTATAAIDIRVPARLEQLTMLRALAETISHVADFAINEVIDIRLALDEVATSLIFLAVPDSELNCRFNFDGEQMAIRVSAVTTTDSILDTSDFGWHIVHTLTNTLDAATAPYDILLGGYPTAVDFSLTRDGTHDS